MIIITGNNMKTVVKK